MQVTPELLIAMGFTNVHSEYWTKEVRKVRGSGTRKIKIWINTQDPNYTLEWVINDLLRVVEEETINEFQGDLHNLLGTSDLICDCIRAQEENRRD